MDEIEEESDIERIFHNNVREQIVSYTFFTSTQFRLSDQYHFNTHVIFDVCDLVRFYKFHRNCLRNYLIYDIKLIRLHEEMHLLKRQ